MGCHTRDFFPVARNIENDIHRANMAEGVREILFVRGFGRIAERPTCDGHEIIFTITLGSALTVSDRFDAPSLEPPMISRMIESAVNNLGPTPGANTLLTIGNETYAVRVCALVEDVGPATGWRRMLRMPYVLLNGSTHRPPLSDQLATITFTMESSALRRHATGDVTSFMGAYPSMSEDIPWRRARIADTPFDQIVVKLGTASDAEGLVAIEITARRAPHETVSFAVRDGHQSRYLSPLRLYHVDARTKPWILDSVPTTDNGHRINSIRIR